jgi:hypothetical protein
VAGLKIGKSGQPIEIAAVVSIATCAGLALGLALAGCGANDTVGKVGMMPSMGSGGGPGSGAAGATGAAGVVGAAGDSGTAGTSPPRVDAASAGDGAAAGRSPAPDASSNKDATAPKDVAPDAAEAGAPPVGEPSCSWPAATGDQKVAATIGVSKMYDGGMKRFVGDGPLGSAGQAEGQPPLFQLANGATLQNVILGNPAADGVHCAGTCTLKNVWWEDVGEDAATSTGSSSSQVMTIDGGGARHASDKVFQHNGAGTMVIQNFCVADFGKLYRSCGNCKTQYPRHAIIRNVSVTLPGGVLAGVNQNYGDSATFSGIFVHGGSLTICERYEGNNTGAEPVQAGSGADGKYCIYAKSDIVSR